MTTNLNLAHTDALSSPFRAPPQSLRLASITQGDPCRNLPAHSCEAVRAKPCQFSGGTNDRLQGSS